VLISGSISGERKGIPNPKEPMLRRRGHCTQYDAQMAIEVFSILNKGQYGGAVHRQIRPLFIASAEASGDPDKYWAMCVNGTSDRSSLQRG